jgi:hypothetical protein
LFDAPHNRRGVVHNVEVKHVGYEPGSFEWRTGQPAGPELVHEQRHQHFPAPADIGVGIGEFNVGVAAGYIYPGFADGIRGQLGTSRGIV